MTTRESRAVRLSVPGKVILMGEHAAVYGRPAVVAAVGLRLFVEAVLRLPRGGSGAGGGGVLLELPDIGVEEERSWRAIRDFTSRARRRWLRFEAGDAPFRPAKDRSALVRIAVGEAWKSLTAPARERLRRGVLELRLRSELPVGAGLGSSAAAAVGVVAAVRAVVSGSPELPSRGGGVAEGELAAIEAAAFEVERRQHGFPSGVDSGTVLRGGILLVRRAGEGLRFDELPRPEWLSGAMEIRDSGTPGQTTGAVVTAVRRRYDGEPEETGALFDRIGAAAEAFRVALQDGGPADGAAAVAEGNRALVELGVVPPPVARRIEAAEAAGGAAKISGAGALEGEAAGALICVTGDRRPESLEALAGYERVDARIGAEGLRFERVDAEVGVEGLRFGR